MPAIQIKPAVLTELQRQLNHELSAAHAYLALAVWCDSEDMKGFARYFLKQSGEEREHAAKIMKHLLDRGALPRLAALAAPETEFPGVQEVARRAQRMEQENTAGIHRCYEAAVREGDYAAQVMLQWFINEQVEEEGWTDEMVARVDRANCAGGVAELDRHIERYLGEAGVGEGEKD